MADKVDVLLALQTQAMMREESGKPELARELWTVRSHFAELMSAASNYYTRYCQDEADDEGPHITGCTQRQSDDARALRDALAPLAGYTP